MLKSKDYPEVLIAETLAFQGFPLKLRDILFFGITLIILKFGIISPSLLRESGLDSKTQEELCSLKLPDSLQPNDLHFFFWKTSRDCYRMTGARRLKPSTPRLLKWGIILNGVCITADISESPSSDGACILSDILIPDVPDKYFLSAAAMRRISGNLSAAPRGKGFTIPTE